MSADLESKENSCVANDILVLLACIQDPRNANVFDDCAHSGTDEYNAVAASSMARRSQQSDTARP